MITLRCLNKKELESFVNSGEYNTFDFLPITKHRALSQIKNEKADENDVLLTLAFEGEKLAGYLGTYPDELNIQEDKVKFAWLSTLYVSENFRGKRIAQQLLDKIFEKYEGKIGITEFTKEAESLYNKIKVFIYINPKNGKRFYFKTDFEELIPQKIPKLNKLKPIFSLIDFSANSLVSIFNKLKRSDAVRFEILDLIDEESEKFIDQFPKNRLAQDINTIIKNPWVLEKSQVEKNYLFSSYAKEFKYFWVKIFDKNGKLEACSLLQLRDKHLKTPYFFGETENFALFMKKFIDDQKIKTLTSYQTELNEKFSKNSFPKLYQKDFERRYMFHKNLLEILPKDYQHKFQDGDGDPVFT